MYLLSGIIDSTFLCVMCGISFWVFEGPGEQTHTTPRQFFVCDQQWNKMCCAMERKRSESGIAQLFFGTPVGRNLKQSVVYNTIHLLLFVIYI